MINPQLQAFLTDWAAGWSTLAAGSGPAARRAHFETVALAMRQPTPEGVTTAEHWIEGTIEGDARRVRVRSFRPAPVGAAQPALIYLHGGAWMQGSPETHWDITAGLAHDTGRVVFSVDYAKAPEQPFPAAVHDVQAVVAWLFEQAAALGVDARQIAIGGDSAGANLAAAMTLAFRGTPQRLQAQLLIYPGLDFNTDRPSYRENPDGPIVSVATMPAVNAAYCPNPADLLNPLAAPLRAASHAGLPTAYLAVAEHDPLRDDGVVYAQVLRDAGVPVLLDKGPGLIHGYLRAMAYCDDVRASFVRMGDWLRALPPV
jgi:acetyl esterase